MLDVCVAAPPLFAYKHSRPLPQEHNMPRVVHFEIHASAQFDAANPAPQA